MKKRNQEKSLESKEMTLLDAMMVFCPYCGRSNCNECESKPNKKFTRELYSKFLNEAFNAGYNKKPNESFESIVMKIQHDFQLALRKLQNDKQ